MAARNLGREVDLETGGDAVQDAPRLARGQRRTDHPSLDATSRAMRRVASRRRPRVVKQSKREIKEMFMRYKVVVTRVQVAERFGRPGQQTALTDKLHTLPRARATRSSAHCC